MGCIRFSSLPSTATLSSLLVSAPIPHHFSNRRARTNEIHSFVVKSLVPDDHFFLPVSPVLSVLSVSGRDRPNSVVSTRQCCTFGSPVQGPGAGVNKLSDRNRGTGSCGSIRLVTVSFSCLLDFLNCDCHCMSSETMPDAD